MALLTELQLAVRRAAAVSYIARQTEWREYFGRWFFVYYLLGMALLICSVTAASAKQIGLSDHWSAILSLLVVILTGTIGLVKPDDRGSRYRQAWSLLTGQLSRFFYESSYTLDDVIRAYEQGEAIIHQAPAAPQPPQGNLPAPAAPH